MSESKSSRRSKDLLSLLVIGGILVLLNILGHNIFHRWDLTEENRYSLSDATKKVLRNLEDVVYIEVFLEGDFPTELADFKRLRNSIEENLEQFRVYGGSNIQYTFTDPTVGMSDDEKKEFQRKLVKKGVQYTNAVATEGGNRTERILFPSGLISFKGKEQPVMFLTGGISGKGERQFNRSIENIEYELISTIYEMQQPKEKRIGLVQGHGEVPKERLSALKLILDDQYIVEPVYAPAKVLLDEYDALIIAGPDTAFSDPEKYKLDQFIVKGGKAIFCIDKTNVSLDSIGDMGMLAMSRNLKIDELLFNLGVRINCDLVQDLYSNPIPMVVAMEGDRPVTRLVPWKFFPLVSNFGKHPIVKNLDALKVDFASSIDTVKADGIRKTPLFYTSKNARILPCPVRVNFNMERIDVKPELFDQGPIAMAYLLEGNFKSMFRGRLSAKTKKSKELDYTEEGEESAVIVISDADLIQNDVNPKNGKVMPMGFDRFTGRYFSNEDFFKNALSYLLDDKKIILTRNKEVKMRPLDRVRVKNEELYWQVINIAAPIILVIIYGIVRFYFRKRKYTKDVF